MSKRVKKKENNKKILVLVLLVVLVAIFLMVLLVSKFFNSDYYKIDTRVSDVENVRIENNSDFKAIGWVRVQGTDLDMPIVWSPSDSEEFPVELGSFVWSNNQDTKMHNQINIMGHNIFNLSSNPKKTGKTFERFEQLMSFVYYDFAKDNKYIQLTLDGKDYLYKIYSVDFIDSSTITDFPLHDDYTKEEMKDYVDLMKKESLYNYSVNTRDDDYYISLVTCTRFFGADDNVQFFVNGRLVRDGEMVNNYKVVKSDKYKKVEKILKGADNDEERSL